MIKKHINKICFILLNILVFLIFLPWLKGHYATDSYNIINLGYAGYSINYSLIDGRIFMFLIMQVANLINIDFTLLHFILLFLALLVSNISVLIVKNIITENLKDKSIKNEILSYIISFTLIYNFMYIENLYFLECFVMAIGILLCIIAAKIFAKKEKLYLIKSCLLVLTSVFCYQGTVSTFIAFILLLEAIKKQPLKEYIINIFIGIVITGIACICNFAFVKIISNILNLNQTRLSFSIFSNLIYILCTKLNILAYLDARYFHSLFMILLIILMFLFIYAFNFKQNKQKYLIFFVFLILGCIFCSDITYIASRSAFGAARTRFAIGALCSILIIYIFTNFKYIYEKYKRNVYYFIYSFMTIYLILNVFNYIDIINTSKLVNVYEKEYVSKIDEYITNYEKENNTVVEKIQLIYSENANNGYFEFCPSKPNGCSCSWSTIGAINFYSNRNLVNVSDSKYIEADMNVPYEIKDDILYVRIAIR